MIDVHSNDFVNVLLSLCAQATVSLQISVQWHPVETILNLRRLVEEHLQKNESLISTILIV